MRTIIAIVLPWLHFVLSGKIIIGILVAFLQITIIGWIPAAIWALADLRSNS